MPKTLPHLARASGSKEIAEDGSHQRHADARAQSLHRPEEDQLIHRLGGSRQQRTHQKECRATQQEPFAPKLVRKLADDGNHRHRGQHIGCNDPGIAIQTMQLGNDARHGRTHNRLIECFQQERKHQRDDHRGQAQRHADELCSDVEGVMDTVSMSISPFVYIYNSPQRYRPGDFSSLYWR